jgi:hypothetical protein
MTEELLGYCLLQPNCFHRRQLNFFHQPLMKRHVNSRQLMIRMEHATRLLAHVESQS